MSATVAALVLASIATLDSAIASGDEERMRAEAKAWHLYYSFVPRPDKRDAYDEQTGFTNSQALVSFVVGGNGSGKTFVAAQKAARFLLEGRAPQWKDTPYWVISDTYEQVCGGAWFQKLRNIIPAECIDHARITWKNRNREWPFSVPLRPHKDDPNVNWVIEFKSYEQGRERMQSTAIGGAWFTEQFPWELFNEVIRGLRENMQPGCVICEFTPIDPDKSIEVEEAFQQWEAGNPQYQHYAFYRMSTEEALKAGHCKREWYDTFFAGVSDEMQDTRRIGAFASYEGAIYQSFDGKIHLVDEIEVPPAVWHRRGIDWGASAEHPFVCLWGFKNALGQWFIYDEYWNNSQTVTILDHIDEIKDRHRWPANSPYHGTTYADPSRPDLINMLSVNGIAMSPANNNVYQGIEAIRKALKVVPGRNEPGLFIDRIACPILAREMRTYRWKRSSGQGLNPVAAKPEPLKRNDDAVDALRYMIYSDYEYKGHVPQAIERTHENLRHGVFLHDRGRRRR